VASLICSLTCIGWLPGIICGHLAKSRIRRDPSLQGGGLALAGLVIGYALLVIMAGTLAMDVWRFSSAVKQGYENVRQDLATNHIIITQTPSLIVSNDHQQTEPAQPVATAPSNLQTDSANSGWMSDISAAAFPDHPASGKIRQMDFAVHTTAFRGGDLKLTATNGIVLDIFHLGSSIEGQSYDVQPNDDSTDNPRVKITWDEDGAVNSETFNKGYGMKLHFDQAKNRRISARIYLCLPDSSKSCVAGTLEVRLPRPRNATAPAAPAGNTR
jgi:hypothetical protein